MRVPMAGVIIAMNAVNANEPEMSYLEHILAEAKEAGLFDGSLKSAIEVIKSNGIEVA